LDLRSKELAETCERQLKCEDEITKTLAEMRAVPHDGQHSSRIGAMVSALAKAFAVLSMDLLGRRQSPGAMS